MANNTPLSGLSDAAGGILLPPEQAGVLTNGILSAYNSLTIAGDIKTTTSRQNAFQIWNGTPTASFVGEGGTKPVTGAEFLGGTLNIKKIATIVTFTDEMLEDAATGNIEFLVDGGIQLAIANTIDANVVGRSDGSNVSTSFDSMLRSTTQTVEVDTTKQDGYQTAVSAAMGTLEANGYGMDMGLVIPNDAARYVRDARATSGGTASSTAQAQALYGQASDPFYNIPRVTSANLDNVTGGAGSGKIVGYVVSRPNLHVRLRSDTVVTRSNEASVGGTSLFQNDLTALRYVNRVGFWIHDIDRSVVALTNAS